MQEAESPDLALDQTDSGRSKRIKIQGLRLKVMEDCGLEDLVPSIDDAYQWPHWTKDALLDLIEAQKVIEGKPSEKVTHAIMFIGHAGCGKTSWPEQVAARINQPIKVVNFNGQMTPSELLGFHTAKAGSIEWVDGVLPYCMRNGIWIVFDEFGYGGNDLRSPLHGVLSPKALLILLEKAHEMVKPHKNFRIFATSNALGARAKYRSIYPGENILNAATLSRFDVYEVDYLHPEAELQVLKLRIPSLTEVQAKAMIKVANMCRDSLEKDQFSHPFSMRELLAWAAKVSSGKNLLEASEAAIKPKVSREDWQTFKGALERVVKAEDLSSKK